LQKLFRKIKSKALVSILDKPVDMATCLRFPIFLTARESLIAYLKKQHIYVSDIWYDSAIAPKQYLNQTNYQHQCLIQNLSQPIIMIYQRM